MAAAQYLAQGITQLWDRLLVTDQERGEFFERNQGLGPGVSCPLPFLLSTTHGAAQVVAACNNELARLKCLKASRMQELIAAAKARVLDVRRVRCRAVCRPLVVTRSLQRLGCMNGDDDAALVEQRCVDGVATARRA